MVTPHSENPSSLDDFGTDVPPVLVEAATVASPTTTPSTSHDDDGWDDALVLPDVDAAPDPVGRSEAGSDGIPKFLHSQPLEDGVTQYEVTRGFTIEGKTYQSGDIIKVQCRFCVLWQREWMEKVRCYPGRTLSNGTIMTADRFSCERYFICKELEPEFKTFLALSHTAVLMVRQLLPASKHILELERWAHRCIKRNDDTNPTEIFRVAKNFLASFASLPQLTLIENFIRDYSKMQSERNVKLNKKRSGRPPLPHGTGDLVSWLEPEFGSVIKGVVVQRARGMITILYIDGPDHLLGQKMKYVYNDWRKDKNPTIVRKAVEAVVKAHT
jgi:hypothetical protein